MNRKAIWISVVIIVAAVLVLTLFSGSTGKGRIEIDAGGADATLRVRHGWFFHGALIKSKYGLVTMQARIYRPQRLSISTERGGDTWLLLSQEPWGNLSKIEVKNNETTVLKLGPPLLIKPRVRRSSSQASIDFSIVGQAGEHYRAAVVKNGRTLAAPGLKIVDEEGKVLASGKFEYG